MINLHLSVAVGVRVHQELDGVRFIWKLCVGQLGTKTLQQLGDLLHCHRKGLNGL